MIVNRIAEPAADGAAIAAVIAAAFEQPDEAELVARLRAEGAMALELVAADGAEIVGHIAFSRLVAPAGAIALAPVAVHPRRHAQGIGGGLIRDGIARLAAAGAPAVIVLGEPDYYQRFGFRAAAVAHLGSPFPPAFLMGLDLTPGWLAAQSGGLAYPRAFDLAD